MGHPLEIFVNPNVNEEFICSICTDVFKNPVCLAQCEHIFCKECISKWLQSHKSCPVDRNKISEADFGRLQKPFLNLLNQLEANCSFADKGCAAVVTLGNWDNHLAICEFSPNYKPTCELGCGARMTATDKSLHNCVKYLLEVIRSKNEENGALVTEQLWNEKRRKILDSAKQCVLGMLTESLSLTVNTNIKQPTATKVVLNIICKCIREEHGWHKIQDSIEQKLQEINGNPWGCRLETPETIKLKVSTENSSPYLDIFLGDLRVIVWKK